MGEVYYKLYLCIDYVPKTKIKCETLEQVEYELNKAVGYNYYIVVEHNIINNSDFPVAQGEIELNRTRYRKGR